jgi:hypothetical protein
MIELGRASGLVLAANSFESISGFSSMIQAKRRCIVFASLFLTVIHTSADEKWAEKWCELNDCYGIRAAESNRVAMEKVEREARKALRR